MPSIKHFEVADHTGICTDHASNLCDNLIAPPNKFSRALFDRKFIGNDLLGSQCRSSVAITPALINARQVEPNATRSYRTATTAVR